MRRDHPFELGRRHWFFEIVSGTKLHGLEIYIRA
jgi:hypothetical protein